MTVASNPPTAGPGREGPDQGTSRPDERWSSSARTLTPGTACRSSPLDLDAVWLAATLTFAFLVGTLLQADQTDYWWTVKLGQELLTTGQLPTADPLSFTFSRRNPARTKLLTANWEPPSELAQALAPFGCGYHYAQALDTFRLKPDGSIEALSLAKILAPLELYRLDHGDPPFMKPAGQR